MDDKQIILDGLVKCNEQYNMELCNITDEIEKCSKRIDEHINVLNDIQLESTLIKAISNDLLDKLNNYKELLKNICDKKNVLKENVDIVFNSTKWIINFNNLEERKEILNNDIIQCSKLVNNVTGEGFNELYINKIINYINDSLNYWLDEIQNIEGMNSCTTKFPLYKIKEVNIKSSDELDKLFIEKILIDSLKDKYEKRKLQYTNLKKILLTISLKSINEINNEIKLIEKRLNKESFGLWLSYYNEYLKNINNNEDYNVTFINNHNKSKEIFNYISEYKVSLNNLKQLKHENINENDKLEKISDEIFTVIVQNLENKEYIDAIENYEKIWNIESDYINLIKYNEVSYEKLYKLYNEINSYILKYNKENSINMSMIDNCNSQLEKFESEKVELEQEIVFRHNQYNKVKDLDNENNQSVNELNKYILKNQQIYLNEINSLIEKFNQTIQDITKKYEERCKDIINEFINIQTWIQNLQNSIKQYSSNLPPKPLFNILGNIISIENDEELDNFYSKINKVLDSTVDESNSIIEDNKKHYDEINKLLNEKLDNYNNIFMEYSNEEKILSMKATVNKSFDLLKEDLKEFNDYCISSSKLVDVEKKTVSLYSKFTYVQYSLKAINNKLKKSEINVSTVGDCKTKIKEIEKEYLIKALNSDYDDCENIINIYNENYYDKTNKKEFVKLLISKMSKSLKDIQSDTYEKYNKLLEKIKYCSKFLNEYDEYYNKLVNIEEEINKLNDFSCEDNMCKLEIEDYKKVFNEILNKLKSMEINECDSYIQNINSDQYQNISGIKYLIDNFKNRLKEINDSINNKNIEHNLINEIYNHNKELKEIRNNISDIQEKFSDFKKLNDVNSEIEMKVVFDEDIKNLENNFNKMNKILYINERYQDTYKYLQKYKKLIDKIKVEEDEVNNEIKKLKTKWKEILNYINKLEEEEKLRKMLEELHKNTKEDEKEYIRELSYLNEISPDKISNAELNNEIQKLNKIYDWIDSKLYDDNFKDYKWEGDPDNLKKLIQNTLDKLNTVLYLNKCITNTRNITEENNKKLDNFKFNIENNRKKIAIIINNIIQNGLLHQQNLEKLRLNIHSLSQDIRKINKDIQTCDKKIQNIISKNEESIEKYKEEYYNIIINLSIESENIKEIKKEYGELILANEKFLDNINKGFVWYKALVKINNDNNSLKEQIVSCIEIEEIFNEYECNNKSKLNLGDIFNSINCKINSWKKSKLEIKKSYEENLVIPFNAIDEFLDINNGLIDINIYKVNESFNQLDVYISKRDAQFKNVNKKLTEIIEKNNEDINNLLNEFKNILSKENISKYSQCVSSSNEDAIILENNYKSHEVQYNEVNRNMNCLLEITSLASETFTSKGNNDSIDNLPINIYQLLMSLLNNPQNIWDYSELDYYNDIIKKSIEITSIYKQKYDDIKNIVNNINLINIKKDESNIPIKLTELKLYKAQILEYENSYNRELDEYNNLNNKYKSESDEHIQYLISCIKKEFLNFIEKSNNLIKNINNTIEDEFNNIESMKKNETEVDDIKKWIMNKKEDIKKVEDDLPPCETLISLENLINFELSEDFKIYNKMLRERIDLNILKGKEKLEINNTNCSIMNDEIKEKKEYINQLGRSLSYIKVNDIVKVLDELNQSKEELNVLCNFTKLFIDFQEIVYLLYGELVFINNQVNSLQIKYKEADSSNIDNPMNTIEELNKKFKAVEEVIKNIQNDGIYKNYEINQKILYKNVLFKINKKEIILQHIIKETKTINELQRKININYEKIKERNLLFKEIIVKIDSCEDNYKTILDLLNNISNNHLNNSEENNINLIHKELKEKFSIINNIMDDENKNLSIIDSLIINNKIKYLNNKVDNLRSNLNKTKEDISCYLNLMKQIELLVNLENLFIKIKTNFDLNEERISSTKNNNYYQERKRYQNTMDKSVQTLIQSYEEVKEKFDITTIKDSIIKENIKEYYYNLINEINDFLENFKNFNNPDKEYHTDNNNKEDKFRDNFDLNDTKEFFRGLLKNNYKLISDRDNILKNYESMYDQDDLNFFRIDELEANISKLESLYEDHSNLYENLSKNEAYNNCDDKILLNNINNIKNEWFSNIEYIKQICNDLQKRNDIIVNKKQYNELKNFLLNIPTSEYLLQKLNNLKSENFENDIEILLQSVNDAINQWNNNASSILNDINDIYKKISNYSPMNIKYIDNEKFENFLSDDSYDYNEINNYILINISKLNNLKDILYNIINFKDKFETLQCDLNERVNNENVELLKKSLNSINSYNELRIINNKYNQDYENIKKDSFDIIESLNKYKYYLTDYNVSLNSESSDKSYLQYIDKAKNKIDEIVNLITTSMDFSKINTDLNNQNELLKLIKTYREKNNNILFLITRSEIVNLKLNGPCLNKEEVNKLFEEIDSSLVNKVYNISENFNLQNNTDSVEIFNNLIIFIKEKNEENILKLNELNNKNKEKYENNTKENYSLNIYDNNNIQIHKSNIHNMMNIYNELIDNLIIIDYINILMEKYENIDISVHNKDFPTVFDSIIHNNQKVFLNYIDNVEREVKSISEYMNDYENLLNNEVKNHKIEDLKYYNEICEILFYIDNSKIRISEFNDICIDVIHIYKYYQDILSIHLKEKYFMNELIYMINNKISFTGYINNDDKFSITSESFEETKKIIKNIEKKYESIKGILNRNPTWDSELYNSIFIINNNTILQLWNEIENKVENIKSEEKSINFISNETNYIINSLEDIKNDINNIFSKAINIFIDNSIDMNDNNENLVNSINSKYVLCNQQCIKNFDNLINYYFNQNFKVESINETINDIHNILSQVNKQFYNQRLIFKYIDNKKLYLEKQFYMYSLLEKIDKLIESNSNDECEVEFNIYLIKKFENEIQQFLVKDVNDISWFNEIKTISSVNEEERKQCLQYITSFNEKIYKRNLIINSKINYFLEKNDLTKFKYSFSRNSSIQNIYENTGLSNIK